MWYVSALLWASTLIYYLLLKKRHLFVYIIFPLLLLFTVGFIYRNKGHIDLTYDVYGFLRAFSEVGFGCVLCEIIDHIKDKKIRINPVLVTAVEIILLAVILYVMYRTRRDYKDFVMVFLIGALIFITFLGEGRFSKLLNRKTFRKLGEICYVMYLNQGVFQFIFRSCFPGLPFWITTVFLIFILAVYSAILLRLERSIKDYVYSLRSI